MNESVLHCGEKFGALAEYPVYPGCQPPRRAASSRGAGRQTRWAAARPARPARSRPWTETSETSAVLCLHWTLLCGLKLSQSSTAYVPLVLLNCKVDSQVCSIDFHLMFIKCFKVVSVDWTSACVGTVDGVCLIQCISTTFWVQSNVVILIIC